MTDIETTYSPLVKTETVHRLEYQHFEELVNEFILGGVDRHVKGSYSFPAGEETSNDTAQTYTVYGTPDPSEDIMEKAPHFQYRASELLEHLAEKGIIPTGKYVIEVCW